MSDTPTALDHESPATEPGDAGSSRRDIRPPVFRHHPMVAIAAFTVITLATGSIWGKPMWGTWWEWDPRLTTELILLFLYLGVMGLYQAIDDRRNAARAAGLLAIVGVALLPVIRYSVVWWNSLHQGQTIRVFGESSMDASMMWPLVWMIVVTMLRVRQMDEYQVKLFFPGLAVGFTAAILTAATLGTLSSAGLDVPTGGWLVAIVGIVAWEFTNILVKAPRA